MRNAVFIQKPPVPKDGDYTPVPNTVWTSDLQIEDKVVLGYLMSHKQNQPVNNIFIANALDVSRKFVGDSLKRLQDKKILQKKNKQYSFHLENLKCNPKLQLSVTQSDTNKTKNKQDEKKKQDDFETVTQSYTSKEKTIRQRDVTLDNTFVDLSEDDIEDKYKDLPF